MTTIEKDMKELLGMSHTMVKDVAPHYIGMSEIVSNLEGQDLLAQTCKYHDLVDQEAQDLIAQLRHRATMLRMRADEMDGIADSLTKFSTELRERVNTFAVTSENTRTILEAHSHINPSKVTNGD